MNGYKRTDEEDPQLLNSLTPGTSDQAGQIQPPPTLPMPQTQPPPAPAPAAVAQVPATPSPKLPGMPPNISPVDFEKYLGKQRGQVDRFGADQQMAQQDAINQRRNSFGYKATEGLKGFADALMMGVARAGNPGFQSQFTNQENQQAADQMNTLRGANESNLKSTEAKMTMDKMNPNSQLSKSAQQSYAPLFEKLGYPANKIQGMSAANIDSTLQLMAAYGGKEIEAKIKEYDLEIERTRLAAALGKNEQDAKKDQMDAERQAAKAVVDAGQGSKFLGFNLPWSRNASSQQVDEALGVLANQMKGGQTQAPYGQTTTRGGVEYEWSPVTQKYHKKGQ